MGNITQRTNVRKDCEDGDSLSSDWDVAMFQRSLNDITFRFEEILKENARLRQQSMFRKFMISRIQPKEQDNYEQSELDELRLMFSEMTTRVQEIVIENNEMYANLQRTDECHRKDMDQLELLKDENCKLQDEIADLATESKKLISQLQLAKDELSNELSDVMKHMKLKEEKAELLEKETVEHKAKFDECQKNSKHLEMKLSYYKEADVEMFRLKTKNKRLVTALAVTAKEKQRLVCKIEQLERLVEEKQQNKGPGQCV